LTPVEYLRDHAEPVPTWISRYREGDPFDQLAFFSSRIAFYPGSGTDGHPVAVFGASGAAHCFVFADYGVDEDRIRRTLSPTSEYRFRGYHVFAGLSLREDDITPRGWVPHIEPGDRIPPGGSLFPHVAPFGFFVVLERDQGCDDDHGPERLAILFLGADGIATFDALFCQKHSKGLYALLLSDHGYGGNYERFGRGGLMDRIASRVASQVDAHPRWILSSNVERDGYNRVPGVDGSVHGRMHQSSTLLERFLYERVESSQASRPR
jgi:hypothetical protein